MKFDREVKGPKGLFDLVLDVAAGRIFISREHPLTVAVDLMGSKKNVVTISRYHGHLQPHFRTRGQDESGTALAAAVNGLVGERKGILVESADRQVFELVHHCLVEVTDLGTKVIEVREPEFGRPVAAP
ncbi:MAG TPA: hypothetical protein VJB98_01545 [Candidatus Paceibacterota bacterium]